MIYKELVKVGFPYAYNFINALTEFLEKEGFLLQHNINERSLTHKLAEYIQKCFLDYNVDCEYNRMLENNDYVSKILKLPTIETTRIDNLTQKTVYPDIIVHKRGTNTDNIVVIEVKKKEYLKNSNKKLDLQKLKAFTKQLNYKLGIYLEFNTRKISQFILYKDGEKVGESHE